MSITYVNGDLLDSNEVLIAHGCNAMGVMGSGIAKSIREKYPVVFTRYRELFEHYCVFNSNTHIPLGMTQYVDVENRTVINVITQETYGSNFAHYKFVSYDAIHNAFKQINKTMDDKNINQIGIPKIGAGLGGGDWGVISAIIESCMPNKQVMVYVI